MLSQRKRCRTHNQTPLNSSPQLLINSGKLFFPLCQSALLPISSGFPLRSPLQIPCSHSVHREREEGGRGSGGAGAR